MLKNAPSLTELSPHILRDTLLPSGLEALARPHPPQLIGVDHSTGKQLLIARGQPQVSGPIPNPSWRKVPLQIALAWLN